MDEQEIEVDVAVADTDSDTVDEAENVRVYIRARVCKDDERCVEYPDDDPQGILAPNGRHLKFDGVMDEFTSQQQVYHKCVEGLIPGIFEGESAAVMCYGQTGSGKTHTMVGDITGGEALYDGNSKLPKELRPLKEMDVGAGIAPRAMADLFEQARGTDSIITCSFLEIYCERVRDLLKEHVDQLGKLRPLLKENVEGRMTASRQNLGITGGAKEAITVKDAHCLQVTCAEDALTLLKAGVKQRITAATKCNLTSSRGHAIFIITVTRPTGFGRATRGQFYLCDLAGSEKMKKTEAKGLRLQEAANINTSLLSLHTCIDQLAHNARHVAYRNSKLTRILQNALGGSGRAVIVCTINPSSKETAETMSTLRFGCTASTVTNHIVANIEKRSDEEWTELVAMRDLEIRRLKEKLRRIQRGGAYDVEDGDVDINDVDVVAPCAVYSIGVPIIVYLNERDESGGFRQRMATISQIATEHNQAAWQSDDWGKLVLVPQRVLHNIGSRKNLSRVSQVHQVRNNVSAKGLIAFPSELIEHIYTCLSGPDMIRLARTCTYFGGVLTAASSRLWDCALKRDFTKSQRKCMMRTTTSSALSLWEQYRTAFKLFKTAQNPRFACSSTLRLEYTARARPVKRVAPKTPVTRKQKQLKQPKGPMVKPATQRQRQKAQQPQLHLQPRMLPMPPTIDDNEDNNSNTIPTTTTTTTTTTTSATKNSNYKTSDGNIIDENVNDNDFLMEKVDVNPQNNTDNDNDNDNDDNINNNDNDTNNNNDHTDNDDEDNDNNDDQDDNDTNAAHTNAAHRNTDSASHRHCNPTSTSASAIDNNNTNTNTDTDTITTTLSNDGVVVEEDTHISQHTIVDLTSHSRDDNNNHSHGKRNHEESCDIPQYESGPQQESDTGRRDTFIFDSDNAKDTFTPTTSTINLTTTIKLSPTLPPTITSTSVSTPPNLNNSSNDSSNNSSNNASNNAWTKTRLGRIITSVEL